MLPVVRTNEGEEMPAQLSPEMWRIGIRNAAICGLGALVAWLLISSVLHLLFNQPLGVSLRTAWTIELALVIFVGLGSWLHARLRAGFLVVDLGPHPWRTAYWSLAGASALTALQIRAAMNTWEGVLAILMVLLSAVTACGRLQVRENGIWNCGTLIAWNRIESYRWKYDQATLLLRLQSRFRLFDRAEIPIPPEHKGRVNALLTEQLTWNGRAEFEFIDHDPSGGD